MPFNFTSTLNGSFTLYSPSVGYVQSAPNIALPPDPVLQLVDNEPDRVVFEWQPITAFGDDLLEFVVYREAPGQSVDFQNPYDTSFANQIIDMAVQPGQTWSIGCKASTISASQPVRTLDGERSLPGAQILRSQPDRSRCSRRRRRCAERVVGAGDPSIVEHQIFVFSTDFNDVSQRTTALKTNATVRIIVVEDSDGAPLIDGTGYYIAVVGIDAYGNASPTSPPSDPFSRNDSELPTTIDVQYTDFTEAINTARFSSRSNQGIERCCSSPPGRHTHFERHARLFVHDDDDNYTVEATNETGHTTVDLDYFRLGPIEALGEMFLTFQFDSPNDDPLTQPASASTATQAAFGTVLVRPCSCWAASVGRTRHVRRHAERRRRGRASDRLAGQHGGPLDGTRRQRDRGR